MSESSRYHVAAFAMDGSLVGTGWRQRADLSRKWSDVAQKLFASAVQCGRVAVPVERLDHLEVAATAAEGAALVTYYAHGQLALSTLLLRGEVPPAEAELVAMFVESLRRALPVAQRGGADAFSALASLTQRPLHVVVPWVHSGVGDDDHELVQELSAHVAGVVLTEAET